MNQAVALTKPEGLALVSTSAGRMSVAEVTQHAIVVQEVMKAVMKEGVHYGTIPFTDKPTLYKAGAEKLCMTFRIADDYRIEDLSTPAVIRYRVTCVGRHQLSGVELGSGMGECSTSEEKYRWRSAVCDEEFEETPATLRRTKYGKKRGGQSGPAFYTAKQVSTDPFDLANTVLKMACKRAKMAMVLNVTAASDCFTQDLEDLDGVLQEHLAGHEERPVLVAVPDQLLAEAKAAADKGRAGFEAFWKPLPKETRLLFQHELEALKLRTSEAEERIAQAAADQLPNPVRPATAAATGPATSTAQAESAPVGASATVVEGQGTPADPSAQTADQWAADMERAETGGDAPADSAPHAKGARGAKR